MLLYLIPRLLTILLRGGVLGLWGTYQGKPGWYQAKEMIFRTISWFVPIEYHTRPSLIINNPIINDYWFYISSHILSYFSFKKIQSGKNVVKLSILIWMQIIFMTFMIKTAPIYWSIIWMAEKILSGHWFSMKIRLEARLNLSNLQVYFWRKLEVTYRRFLRACRRRLLYVPVNPARYLPILRCCCCSDEASKLVAPCQTIEGCWEFDYRTHQDH